MEDVVGDDASVVFITTPGQVRMSSYTIFNIAEGK